MAWRTPPVSAVVLAGGESRRMGVDKRLIDVGGRSLLELALDAVGGLADDVVVATREGDEAAPQIAARAGARVCVDRRPRSGPMGGLEAGLAAAAHEVVLVIASDMPFVSPAVLELLAAEARARPGAAAVVLEGDGGPEPLLGAYRRSAVGAATALLDAGERRMSTLLDLVGCHVVPRGRWAALDPEARSLVNLNSPSDVATMVARGPGGLADRQRSVGCDGS